MYQSSALPSCLLYYLILLKQIKTEVNYDVVFHSEEFRYPFRNPRLDDVYVDFVHVNLKNMILNKNYYPLTLVSMMGGTFIELRSFFSLLKKRASCSVLVP